MALATGSVTVDVDDLTHTGDGLALSLYEAFKSRLTASGDWASFSDAQKLSLLQGNAQFAEDMATGIVPYLTANGDVRITTSDSALQRASGTDTDAPSADRVLSGAIE